MDPAGSSEALLTKESPSLLSIVGLTSILESRFPGSKTVFFEHDARAPQASLFQRGDQRVALERTHEEHEVAAATGTQQLAADGTVRLGEVIDIIEFAR